MSKVMAIDKSKLSGLSMTKVGGKVSRLQNQSTKLNTFLAGEFKIPTSIKDSAKWAEKQIYGCANLDDISVLIDVAISKSVKDELTSTTNLYSEMELTDKQTELLPAAITKYEKYLNDYFAALKILKTALQLVNKVKEPVEKVKEPEPVQG